MRHLLLILALAVPAVAWAQAPVCWKNDQGVTECGNHPPPGVDARVIKTPQPATNEAAETAEAFAEADLDGDVAARRAILLRHCELARETLAAYNKSDFLYERDATGNRRLLDEAETAAAKANAQHAVDTQCAEFPESAP